MQKASSFLARFKNLKVPERSLRSTVVTVVYELTGVVLSESEVKISGDIIFIQTRSAMRAHIFSHKQLVLARINNVLGQEQVRDIQ